MADTGVTSPGTMADDSAVGTISWSNPDNAKTSNNTYVTAVLANGEESHYLNATNFGFTVPIDATIDGILVEIERKASEDSSNYIYDSVVKLRKSTGLVGSNLGILETEWSTSESYKSYGNSSNMWGTTFTPAEVNNSGFGVSLQTWAEMSSGTLTASVDHIRITVYYTEFSSSSSSSSFSSSCSSSFSSSSSSFSSSSSSSADSVSSSSSSSFSSSSCSSSFSSSSYSSSCSSYSSSSNSFSSSSFSSDSVSSSFSSSSSSTFTPGLYEHYNTGNNDSISVAGTEWRAQSFTAESDHLVSSCKLLLGRNGSDIGTINAEIYATDVDGKPTGSPLMSGSYDGDTLPLFSSPGWIEFSFGTSKNISNTVVYAIVLTATNVGSSNWIQWSYDSSSSTYTGGEFLYSFDSGASWAAISNLDYMFEIWGATSSSSSSFSSSISSGSVSSSFSSSSSSFSSSSFSSSSSSSAQTFPYQMVFYPDADPEDTSVDGYVGRIEVDQTFADIKVGAGNLSDDSSNTILTYLKASTTNDQFEELKRGILLFDTTSLPDDCTVTSAILSLYGISASNGLGSPDLYLGSSSPGLDTSLSDGDYGSVGDIIIDSYSESNEDYSGIVSHSMGQTFTNSSRATLDSCKFYLYKIGNPTGNAIARIYAHTGVYGTSGKPIGPILATSDNFDVSTLTNNFLLKTFTFTGSNKIVLEASTHYCVALEYTNGDGSNYINEGSDISSPTHSGNQFYSIDGINWLTLSTVDTIFYVYTSSFGSIAYADWGVGYKDITLNVAGLNAISKDDVTKFSTLLSWDINNSFGGAWSSEEESGFTFSAADAGVSYRPYLTVNFTTTSSSSSYSSCSSSFSSCSSSFSSSSYSSCSSSYSSSSFSSSSSSSSFSSSSSSSLSSVSSSFSSSSSSFSSSSFSSSSFSSSSSSFSSSSSSFSSSSYSSCSSSFSSSSFSSHSLVHERGVMIKLYDKDNVYQRNLNEAVHDTSVEKTLYHGSGPTSIVLNTKVDDLASDITLNSKIKIYFRNKWNDNPTLVYYGYIVSIDPFIQRGNEKTTITCLGAISKLKNDFLAQSGEYLAFEVENKEIDQHINEILDNYRDSINDTYGDYDPCMIDDPVNYWSDTDYVEDTLSTGKIPYRYFTSKHLDAIYEIGKFLPKNQGAGDYWYYYLDDGDNSNDRSRFILKKLSTSADHTLQINKHIDNLTMRKNIEEVINTVYFWNEDGTIGDKVLMTATDSTSQLLYDKIADRITDSKISTYKQADLLAQARLKEAKDIKAELVITVSDVNYDILSFKLGQVINIRDTKKGTDLYPDNVLIIQKIILTPREAILELAKPRPDLSTQVESDREYIDRQLVWFGKIMTRVDATHLEPGGLHWITDDITFTPDSNTQISWSTGTFELPNGVQRVIASGDTGNIGTDPNVQTYLYVDEKNVWCGKDVGSAPETYGSGTGSVKAGENTLIDLTAGGIPDSDWKKDQWKGYALWINPDSVPEKHIITQNYAHEIMVEGHDPFNTTDAACDYEIHKLVLRKTTNLSRTGLIADSGSTTTLVDSALTEAIDFWNGYEMKITSGDNIGLTRTINNFGYLR